VTTIPILLDLGIIKIYTIGTFLTLALIWSLFIFWRTLKLTHFREEDFFDIILLANFFAFLGARLVYIILHFEQFGWNFMRMILVNGFPGLSLVGAFLFGIGSIVIMLKQAKIDPLEALDYFMPAVILFFVIGKAGSFLAGSDVGTTTEWIVRMRVLGHEGLRHPVALYEAILASGVYFGIYKIIMSTRRGIWKQGSATMGTFALLGLILFVFDKIKVERLYLLGIGLNIWAGLITFIVCGGFFFNWNKPKIIELKTQLLTLISKK